MIRAMTAGTIYGKPSQRTGTNGKHFATAKLRADGKDGESVWVSLLGFGEVGERLSALPDGAAIAVSGRAEVRAWSDKDGSPAAGLDVTVDEVATLRGRPKPQQDRRQPTDTDDAGVWHP